jgi:hypothetical protein
MAHLFTATLLLVSTGTTTAFVVVPKNCVVGVSYGANTVTPSTSSSALWSIVTGPSGRAATSFEEDLRLTLQIIRDHEARSTTVSTEQFLQQEQTNAAVAATAAATATAAETIDIAVPYDAAARLAYQRANVQTDYAVFREQYEKEAVAMVTAKKAASAAAAAAAAVPTTTAAAAVAPAVPVTGEAATTTTVDVSVPYDAAARLAFETATTILSWDDFKLFYETEAIASVVAKRAARDSPPSPPAAAAAVHVDISVPYDAAARLAYASQADSSLPYEEFKAQFEAQAIQDVMAKRGAPPTTHAAAATALTSDVSVPYDAAARLAYASQTNNALPFDEFKVQFEAQAIQDVMAKKRIAAQSA